MVEFGSVTALVIFQMGELHWPSTCRAFVLGNRGKPKETGRRRGHDFPGSG
jgi:hypothetical protein